MASAETSSGCCTDDRLQHLHAHFVRSPYCICASASNTRATTDSGSISSSSVQSLTPPLCVARLQSATGPVNTARLAGLACSVQPLPAAGQLFDTAVHADNALPAIIVADSHREIPCLPSAVDQQPAVYYPADLPGAPAPAPVPRSRHPTSPVSL